MTLLQEGDFAPDFTLDQDQGAAIHLFELRGNPVVIFFYPKDDTSGCTQEALDFTARKAEFDALNVTLLGVSPDPVKKHEKFRAKHELTVTLLSDPEKTTLSDYQVWVEKSMYGRKYMGVERSTFLVDATGKIAKIWRKVKVPGHVDEVLSVVKTVTTGS